MNESHAIDEPKHFGVMTAKELAEYSGMIYMARCTFESKITGKTISCDYECPTRELRVEAVGRGCRHIGRLLSQTDYNFPWQKSQKETD